MLRREKKDHLEIPDKKEAYIYVGLTAVQKEIYKNLLTNHNPLGNTNIQSYNNILVQVKN